MPSSEDDLIYIPENNNNPVVSSYKNMLSIRQQFFSIHHYLVDKEPVSISKEESNHIKKKTQNKDKVVFFCKNMFKMNKIFSVYLFCNDKRRAKPHYKISLEELNDIRFNNDKMTKHPTIGSISQLSKQPVLFWFNSNALISDDKNESLMLSMLSNSISTGNLVTLFYVGDEREFLRKYSKINNFLKDNGYLYCSMNQFDSMPSRKRKAETQMELKIVDPGIAENSVSSLEARAFDSSLNEPLPDEAPKPKTSRKKSKVFFEC